MDKTISTKVDVPLMTSQEKVAQVKNAHKSENQKKQDDPEYEKMTEDPIIYEPPDGGWGWCVVFATAICTMVLSTMGPCFGIFYGDRLRELGGTPTLAAWLFNFQSSIWNLAGPWAGVLSEKFTYRPVAMVSAFLASSSLILSAMVTNPYLLLFTFSVASGIGGGICLNCCFHMLAKYFNKRYGLANGIMLTGGSLGLMLMPQMASYLQQIYPFEWATVIAGAVMMNTVAAVALFHPVEWHAKKSIPRTETVYAPLTKDSYDSGITSSASPKESGGGFLRSSSVPHHLMSQDAQRKHITLGSELKRKRRASESPYLMEWNQSDMGSRGLNTLENEKVSFFQYGSGTLSGSVLTIQQLQLDDEKMEAEKCDDGGHLRKEAKDQGIWKKFLSHYKPAVLRDPLVVSMALCTCITITSALNILSTMPFVLNDAGYSLQSAASAISVAAMADLVTRAVCAATTDRSWVNPRILYGIAQVISIIAPIGLIIGWSNWSVVLVCMSAMGVGLGILCVLDVFIIIRVLGVQKLQSVFGMSQLFRVVAFSTLGPIGGVLRDVTGSYASAIIFYTCNIFLGLLILISTAFYTRYQSHSRMQTHKTNH